MDNKVDDYYQYELKGINVHTGSADGGHYFSFIDVNRDGKNNSYKLAIPDTTSWTADKTIATVDGTLPSNTRYLNDVTYSSNTLNISDSWNNLVQVAIPSVTFRRW